MKAAQIKIGIPKIVSNAVSLYSDATLLATNNRIERAFTLYQLSIEELGKAFILLRYLLFENTDEKKTQIQLRKDLKNHQVKSKYSIGLDFLIQGFIKTIDPDKYESLVFKSLNEHINIGAINEKKNQSLYVSFNGNKFLLPSECISTKNVEEIKNKAGSRIFIAKNVFMPIIENISYLKEKMAGFELDKSRISKEQQDEFVRIITKFK